ncbi:GH32 C-terminal domain-containing protein [Jannaschia sp. R86511]|uniref:GH32 C-terminal domain-containing protein n=1 Tax=Jannaschia sp. R86511 TaxID=3093853 RepID=UPI0036D34AC3
MRSFRLVAAMSAVVVLLPLVSASASTGSSPVATGSAVVAEAVEVPEPFRPAYHFSPKKNWLNDPNGLVYYDGEYHLFFQYNPDGTTWGNMSWGHAVSKDLQTWDEMPVAIEGTPQERIFSGGVVVDHDNTSGLGTPGNTAMVALYTSWYEDSSRHQAQSVAYSLDKGRTWTKHPGNPVLRAEPDGFDPLEFRDPKVFWYEPENKWVMSVALATERRIALYSSPDLLSWDLMSTFGPAGATGGVWEVPDLFELPVNGDPDNTAWVLLVNLNPGSIAGGSGAQYFVGDFDGTTFTSDDGEAYEPPAGEVLADFEGGGYGDGWRSTGTAFGAGPASGTLPGQQQVTGYLGEGLVNSFLGGDGPTGTLASPEFTIDRGWVNLLVGGGAHERPPGTGDGSVPPGIVLEDFEGGWGGWELTGEAFGVAPVAGDARCQEGVAGYLGERLANSFDHQLPDACSPPPDSATGTATSSPFTVNQDHLSFLVGGGPHVGTAVQLMVDGEVVRSTSGRQSGTLDWASWDVSALRGRQARLRLVDEVTGGWGHVLVDHVVLGPEPALPRSQETAVNLVVDGEVVRNASGADAEAMDWVAWDVSGLQGRTARIEVVDRNSGGWGHINVDHIMLADDPARSVLQRARWLDHGRDYYAAVSWEDQPDGKRWTIAWMNNWQYANDLPTSPWRGQMTLPRELSLVSDRGEVTLVQQPVTTPSRGAAKTLHALGTRTVRDGRVEVLDGTAGETAQIDVRLDVGTADRAGLVVRSGAGEGTVIGYDAAKQELYVDRRRSGVVGFHPEFASVERVPLDLDGGTVRLQVFVDRSSVEVFADGGRVTVTDLVFPSAGSDAVELFADSGAANFIGLRVNGGSPASLWTGRFVENVVPNPGHDGGSPLVSNQDKSRSHRL